MFIGCYYLNFFWVEMFIRFTMSMFSQGYYLNFVERDRKSIVILLLGGKVLIERCTAVTVL